ncbi:YdcF family protein [Gryllotalpicola reticulitermitis]|uniref:YdcF family protein n=1 Tax=Gryllotalpicola reticulitermitis TaxID=1184153 RepID=A0ABV8Q4N7_9MICO
MAIALAGIPIYVVPHTDKPARVDAIVVIGPPYSDRITLAQHLVSEGYADHIYLSVPTQELTTDVCRTAGITCFHELPFTTRGEARFTHKQAAALNWSSVIVITGQYHISRARYIFDRCSGVPTVRMIESYEPLSPTQWVHQYMYQTAGFAKALAVGCAAP